MLESVLQLSHDQYGNYVVQHLVAKGPSPARWAARMGAVSVALGSTRGRFLESCQQLLALMPCTAANSEASSLLTVCCQAASCQATPLLGTVPSPLLTYTHQLYSTHPKQSRQAIVSKVAPQVMTLAQHKYASNVVEACLKHGAQEHRDAILE